MKIDEPVLDFCKKHGVVYLNKIELMQCIMNGMSIRKAAETTGLSYLTVNSYLRDFYRKHGFEGRKDLMSEIYKYSVG